MTSPDLTNPCELAAYLKVRRAKILAGEGVTSIRQGDNDVGFMVPQTQNLPALDALILRADTECAALQGKKTGRRRAFVAR